MMCQTKECNVLDQVSLCTVTVDSCNTETERGERKIGEPGSEGARERERRRELRKERRREGETTCHDGHHGIYSATLSTYPMPNGLGDGMDQHLEKYTSNCSSLCAPILDCRVGALLCPGPLLATRKRAADGGLH